MEVTARKSSIAILAAILAVAVVVVTGCSGAAPTAVPPSPTAKTGAPAKLTFVTQPGNGTAGSSLSTQPAVAIQDSNGSTVTGSVLWVKLEITSGTGAGRVVLFGPSTVGAVNGMAKFTGLSVNRSGTGYTITATSGNLAPATSAPFSISPGAPAQLSFSVQPSGGVAGSPLTTQPQVTVEDEWGNTATGYEGSVTLGITFGTGLSTAAVSGTTAVRVVNSVARFTDIWINKTSTEYTLTAMGSSLAPATSLPFEVSHAAPAKLEFTVQPADARAGKEFESQPRVVIEDKYGNVATSSKAPITVSITPGTGAAGAVLSGTKTLPAEDAMGGLAEFTDLAIDRVGSGYTLTATSAGLASASSQAFDVAP